MRKQSPKSIEEMNNHGYFHRHTDWFEVKQSNLNQNLLYTSSSNHVIAEHGDISDISYFKSSKKQSIIYLRPPASKRKYIEYTIDLYEEPLKFASDNLFSLPLSIKVSKNLYFYKAIYDTLKRLFEAGMMNSYFFLEYNDKEKKPYGSVKNPREAKNIFNVVVG